jgi:hypothetical protein
VHIDSTMRNAGVITWDAPETLANSLLLLRSATQCETHIERVVALSARSYTASPARSSVEYGRDVLTKAATRSDEDGGDPRITHPGQRAQGG